MPSGTMIIAAFFIGALVGLVFKFIGKGCLVAISIFFIIALILSAIAMYLAIT